MLIHVYRPTLARNRSRTIGRVLIGLKSWCGESLASSKSLMSSKTISLILMSIRFTILTELEPKIGFLFN